ncbi:hypothetical protein BDE02_02G103400 [Populus trichocarpa]|nr:hypothetical protein BDE02_02G103400 [Populus trichocarpa]
MRDNASWFVPVSSPLVTMETFIHDPLEITSCFYKPSYLLFQGKKIFDVMTLVFMKQIILLLILILHFHMRG